MTLKHDKVNETVAGQPPINEDVTYIKTDYIIT